MNIIYIGAFRLPNFDAAAARVLNVSRSLRESGHQVRFISWGGAQRDQDRAEDGKWYVDGFQYIVTNELPQVGMSRIERLWSKYKRGRITKRLLNEWEEHIDIIISYNNSLCRWLIPFCKERNIRLISDVTEWYSFNELRPSDWLSYSYEMLVVQNKIKNKIVISSYLNEFYRTTHNVVVPATCDSSETKWKENLDYARDMVGEYGGITLIYAGNPAKKDMVHHIINAVQRLVNEGAGIRFLILGTTRESYCAQYSSYLHSRVLSKNIQFLGTISQDLIPSFYHQADFMVLIRAQTRKSNAGFPTKLSESFTSGTPVIANLTSDLSFYLKDGKTGFVVEEPSEKAIYNTLKEKVLRLSPNQIKAMKANVKADARRLDYHAYVEPLRDFMNNLE